MPTGKKRKAGPAGAAQKGSRLPSATHANPSARKPAAGKPPRGKPLPEPAPGSTPRPRVRAPGAEFFFHASPLPMALSHIEDGLYEEVNPAFLRKTGYARRQVVGRSALELGLWADPGERRELIAAFRRTGRFPDSIRVHIRLRDGRVVPCLLSATVVRWRGRRLLLTVIRDIEELGKAEERLRHSEERFRVAFMTSPDAMAIHRLHDGVYIEVNPGFTRLSGYTEADVIGRSTIDIGTYGDPGDRQRIRDGLRTHGRVDELKIRFRLKDGQVRVGLLSAAVIQLQGEPHILSITRDIDEAEKAADRLRESEERFREMIEHLPQAVVETDPAGRITFFNRAAQAMCGYGPEDLVRGLTSRDLVHPDDHLRLQANVALNLQEKGTPGSEYKALHRDGHAFPVLSFTSPIRRDGRLVGLRGVIVDLSKQRRAEAALHESEDRSRVLLDTMKQGVLELDLDGRVVYSNPAAAAILESSSAELSGRFIGEMSTQAEGREQTRRLLERLRHEQPAPTPLELRRRLRDGGQAHIIVEWQFKRDGGGRIIGFIVLINDVTEKARLEERLRQAQKIEATGQLAGGVAHDFNNLLTPIIGYSELLLLATPAADPRHGQLAEVLQAAERARKLVQQLLAFGRKQMVEMKVLDLNRLLDEFQRLLLPAMREDIELQIQPAASLGRVRGDPSQIEVALMNLAVNARDAMPDGGRIVIATSDALLDEEFCRQRPPTRPGAYVMVSVSDNGAGMSEEVQRHLFEPFFTTKALGRGTGLGLATVYGITKQHNGFIWVTSEPGRGSTFSIYLPRVDEPLDAERPAAAPAPASAGGETILLMEDNGTVRELVRTILQRAGYHVLAPATLEECRRLFAAESARVDLLLSDVVMPELNGPQLFRELAAQKPGLKVLFMSGYTDEIVSRHGIPEQDFAFIQKPITYHTLTTRVRTVLDAGTGRPPAGGSPPAG